MIKQIRQNVSSESAFEPAYGFSRVVRVGNQVSGTTAIKADGTMEGGQDSYGQAMATFRKIEGFLQKAGAGASDCEDANLLAGHDQVRWCGTRSS
jgi:enamine deaminase RidA (YjgF/YER057c/UK114 family)